MAIDDKRLPLKLLAGVLLAAALLACSTLTETLKDPDRAPSQSTEPATVSPEVDSSVVTPTPTTSRSIGPTWAESELPPLGFERILQAGVDQGIWTEAEGLRTLLRVLVGDLDASEVRGMQQTAFLEGTGIVARAHQHTVSHPDDPLTPELQALLDQLLPPEENLLNYSLAEGEAESWDQGVGRLSRPAEQLNCRSLWQRGFPGYQGTNTDLVCFLVATEVVHGRTFRVFYPNEWSSNESRRQHAHTALQAAVQGFESYRPYGDQGDVTIIFVPWQVHSERSLQGAVNALAHTSLKKDWEACPVLIFPQATRQGTGWLQWTVAHEVFHCFQADALAERESHGASVRWWVEGSAVYFSNVAYPDFQGKHIGLKFFEANSNTLPIPKMSYESYVFFHYLGNQRGNDWVVDLLDDASSTAGSNQTQLLTLRVPQDLFHEFGRAYLDEEIMDTNGELIPIVTQYQSRIDIDRGFGKTYQADPFVLRRHQLNYQENHHFMQTFELQSDGLIATRPRDASGWQSPLEQIRTFCEQGQRVLLLTTTRSDTQLTVEHEVEEVRDDAWTITVTSPGGSINYSGDHALFFEEVYTSVGGDWAGVLTHSQTGPTSELRWAQTQVLDDQFFLQAGGFTGGGYGIVEILSESEDSLTARFSADFWTDPMAQVMRQEPALSASGDFQACRTEPSQADETFQFPGAP